jgi:hypothetical protein
MRPHAPGELAAGGCRTSARSGTAAPSVGHGALESESVCSSKGSLRGESKARNGTDLGPASVHTSAPHTRQLLVKTAGQSMLIWQTRQITMTQTRQITGACG